MQRKMADLRLVCDQEIRINQQKADSAMNSFRKYLQSIKLRSEETIGDQGKIASFVLINLCFVRYGLRKP